MRISETEYQVTADGAPCGIFTDYNEAQRQVGELDAEGLYSELLIEEC